MDENKAPENVNDVLKMLTDALIATNQSNLRVGAALDEVLTERKTRWLGSSDSTLRAAAVAHVEQRAKDLSPESLSAIDDFTPKMVAPEHDPIRKEMAEYRALVKNFNDMFGRGTNTVKKARDAEAAAIKTSFGSWVKNLKVVDAAISTTLGKKLMKSVSSFTDKMNKAVTPSVENFASELNNAETPEQKSTKFNESVRRGILDPDQETQETEQNFSNKLGKFLGMFMPHEEREAIANKTYRQEASLERAKSDDPAVRDKMFAWEERAMQTLESRLKAGEVDTKGVEHGEYLARARRDIVARNNVEALRMRDPTANVEYQKQATAAFNTPVNLVQPDDVQPVAEQVQQVTPSDDVQPVAEQVQQVTPSDEIQPQDPMKKFNALLDSIQENSDYVKYQKQSAEQPLNPAMLTTDGVLSIKQIKTQAIKTNSFDVKNAEKKTKDKIDAAVAPAIDGKKNLEFDNVTIKALTIQSMILPEQESADSSSGSDSGTDIDLKRTKPGRPGKPAKPGKPGMPKLRMPSMSALGSFAMGAAPLALMAEASREAGNADIDDKSSFNLFSKVGQFGKSFSEKAADMFGSPTDSAELAKIKSGVEERGTTYSAEEAAKIKSKYGYEIPADSIAPVTSKNIMPALDKKQADLASARAEQDQLLQMEKQSSNSGNNVVINSPTNVVQNKSTAPVMPGTARPTHNAYERFIDRVFTA